MRLYTTTNLTTEISANVIARSFSAALLRIQPNGDFPIFGITGLGKTKKIGSTSHSYYSKTAVFPQVTLDGAIADGVTTSFTVDDSSPLKIGSVLLVYKVTTGTYTAPELVRVTAIPDATTLTVTRGVGGTTGAAIADNTVLFEVGNSYGEGSDAPTARAIAMTEHTNFTQIFRNSWDVTRTAAAVNLEPGVELTAENKEDAAFFHASAIEWATIFGRKEATTDPATGNPMRYMDGIESIITQFAPGNVNAAGATTTFNQLEALLHPTLDYKTNRTAGNKRMLLCGATAYETIHKIGRLSGYFELTPDSTVFGTDFVRFRTSRGNFSMMEHPLLNSNEHTKSMCIIADMSSFDYKYLTETFHTDIGFDQTGRDATSGVFTTELTIEMMSPLSWGIIYNLVAAAA